MIYSLVGLAQQWTAQKTVNVEIDLSPWALPRYAFYSFVRASIAYGLSLVFTLIYGYAAAKLRKAERVLISLLDILQSIPVLGFLPSLVLGLVQLFPDSTLGVEIACIIMIFTGQAWNMTFSFYSSVKAVPEDLKDVSSLMGLSWFQRFKRIELPYSAIGLAWNSLVSMAGGWFFLAICESFVLGDQPFQLLGIGSYVAVASQQGDPKAMFYGIIAMCIMIVFVDFLIWRPIMVWVRKFQTEQTVEEVEELPFITMIFRQSTLLQEFLRRLKIRFVRKKSERHLAIQKNIRFLRPLLEPLSRKKVSNPAYATRWHKPILKLRKKHIQSMLLRAFTTLMIGLCIWGGIQLWELMRTLGWKDWQEVLWSLAQTGMRVFLSLILASLWTIPAGILIALSPRLMRIFQPIIQIVASFPAPMVYPMVILVLNKIGLQMYWGSAILMMIGVQWYILFNALAGASMITRDLRDSMRLMRVSTWARWMKLYLPAAFPFLVTGWITAAGGAWNASIVAEYLSVKGKTLVAPGLGSLISISTMQADYPKLAASLFVMVLAVVGLNQSLWRWLAETAEKKKEGYQ